MIKEGDLVNIYWENLTTEFNVVVLYTPSATGDSWHLRREDGTIIYVNSFSMMEKIGEPE